MFRTIYFELFSVTIALPTLTTVKAQVNAGVAIPHVKLLCKFLDSKSTWLLCNKQCWKILVSLILIICSLNLTFYWFLWLFVLIGCFIPHESYITWDKFALLRLSVTSLVGITSTALFNHIKLYIEFSNLLAKKKWFCKVFSL